MAAPTSKKTLTFTPKVAVNGKKPTLTFRQKPLPIPIRVPMSSLATRTATKKTA